MTLALVRLDDRLIHGQVVVGWGHATKAEAILLIDDGVHESDWEQELYRMGVPAGVDVEFASAATGASAIDRCAASPKRTVVLMADVETLVAVCAKTASVRDVNLGGLHERDGRTRRLRYVYLSDDEAGKLQALQTGGIRITAQDVPTARAVPLEELL